MLNLHRIKNLAPLVNCDVARVLANRSNPLLILLLDIFFSFKIWFTRSSFLPLSIQFLPKIGQGQVPVWQDKDLFPCWSSCLSRKIEGRQVEGCLHPDPEDNPRVAAAEEVPAHEEGSHHRAEIRARLPGPMVGLLATCPLGFMDS